MKRSIGIIFFLSVILTLPLRGNANDTPDLRGAYVGLIGGVAIPSPLPTTVTDNTDGGKAKVDISMKLGFLAGLKAGYRLPFADRIFSAELEYNHIESNTDTGKKYSGTSVDTKITGDLIMLNLIARQPAGKWHPYVGAGAGYAIIRLNDVSGVSEGAKVLSLPGQTLGAFAYQFFIGLDYDINKNWYVGLNYKYLITQSVSYTVTGTDTVTGTPQSGTFETQFSSHLVMLTIGYQF